MSGYHRQGRYRFLLSRRWLGLLGAALLAAACCVALGQWQLDRLSERHQRNDLLERNLDARPSAPDDLLRVGHGPADGDVYARVRARGRYDRGRQLLVRTRPFEGRVGYYVLTPFVTDAGPALLLVRGWVPGGASAESLPDVPAPPAGTVSVTARVRPSEAASTTG
ncbi:MAG TPA: SURF1 family protein, partial [Actinomycetes bacterium]